LKSRVEKKALHDGMKGEIKQSADACKERFTTSQAAAAK